MRETKRKKENGKTVKTKITPKMTQEKSAKATAKQTVGIKSMPQGITLIALAITILFSYDEKLKCSNNKGFLLQTI